MRFRDVKKFEDVKPVLMDVNCTGPELVYFVLDQILTDRVWANMTVLSAGFLGKEYPKTNGHYHKTTTTETYTVVHGKGIMQLQEKMFKDGQFVLNEVTEVYLVEVNSGEKIITPPNFGHSWSNVGNEPLVTYDDCVTGHEANDYGPIQAQHGFAYYLTEVDGKIVPVPNSNYKNLPVPVFLPAAEFNNQLGK